MHIHLRLQHWVLWWFYVGVACGVVAVVNILSDNLTRSADHDVLAVGTVFWALGGVVCWASEAIQIQDRPPSRPRMESTAEKRPATDAIPEVLNRQWQSFAVRDVARRMHGHHLYL